MNKIKLSLLVICGSTLLFCQSKLVNTAHLDHLYEDVIVNNDTLGIIHIYAEYPDYKWVDDVDEGTACVDDAARAMVFYLYHYHSEKEPASLKKVKNILNFLFYMQAENGFFYNFIWKDNSINKDFRTSVAEPNWWSWRALWALSEANKFFKDSDLVLAGKIKNHIEKLINASVPVLDAKEKYTEFGGFKIPLWLPYETAADQAGVILKALSIYFESEKDSSVINVMKKLSAGVIQMQAGDRDHPPYHAFLSWQNTWHAWGNSQADALINLGRILKDTTLINSALNEVNYFYTFLTWKNYFSDFTVESAEGITDFTAVNPYPQIAYGFRPMIFASMSAYEYTNDPFYAQLAGTIASWFFGRNRSEIKMYDPNTGICYDGLMEDNFNRNSGAESTIEALLALLRIESNPSAKEMFFEVMNSK